MRKLALLSIAIGFVGCAHTETTQSLAAKTLLSARETVVVVATGADGLCATGTISVQDCDSIREKYTQAKVSYTTASNLLKVALRSDGDPGWFLQYRNVESEFLRLYQDFLDISRTFNIGGAK